MSQVSHYECETCKKVTHDLLYWFVLDGDLRWVDSNLGFSFSSQNHWCSKQCLIEWIDKNPRFQVNDGQLYRSKSDEKECPECKVQTEEPLETLGSKLMKIQIANRDKK